jgi:DNA-binding transcriptional LysR family regulator
MRSEWDVARELREGRLVRVLPDHVLPSADIVALTPDASAHSSARTRYFLEFLQAEVSPALWAGPSQVPDLL